MRIFFFTFSAYLISVIAIAIPLSSRSSEISTRNPRAICDLSSPVSTSARRLGELFPRGTSNTNRRQKARKKATARKRNRTLRPPRPTLSGNADRARPPKLSRNAARKEFPIGSVVRGRPLDTVNQPLLTNQAGIIKEGARQPHPMIVIGHSKKGNLKVMPISHNPPDPRISVNDVAPSVKLKGNGYVGSMVVIHPNHVSKKFYSKKKATHDEVKEVRQKLQEKNPKQTWTKW